jgi:hypothetical protein
MHHVPTLWAPHAIHEPGRKTVGTTPDGCCPLVAQTAYPAAGTRCIGQMVIFCQRAGYADIAAELQDRGRAAIFERWNAR